MSISTCALREEGDDWPGRSAGRPDNFYPRPPRGGRPKEQVIGDVSFEFLSTPSARRATPYRPSERGSNEFLSTPSARRATPRLRQQPLHLLISIHALREEGDSASVVAALDTLEFLSTPSARRATTARAPTLPPTPNFYPRPPRGGRHLLRLSFADCGTISIHALREEGDLPVGALSRAHSQFLSTPSARRATRLHSLRAEGARFLSTPSARRATPSRT